MRLWNRAYRGQFTDDRRAKGYSALGQSETSSGTVARNHSLNVMPVVFSAWFGTVRPHLGDGS